jgi:GGDEF domain-containing protein
MKVYNRAELESKKISELKEIAASLNVSPTGDARKKEVWTDAILAAMPQKRDMPVPRKAPYTMEPIHKTESSSIYLVRKYGQILGSVIHHHAENRWSCGNKNFQYPVEAIAELEHGDSELVQSLLKRIELLEGELYKDPLTEVFNRRKLRKQPQNQKVGVIVFDLIGFGEVNKKMGHEVGDRLLQDFAESLRIGVRKEDSIFRYGGDEFVIVGDFDEVEGWAIAHRIKSDSPFYIGVSTGYLGEAMITAFRQVEKQKREKVQGAIA